MIKAKYRSQCGWCGKSIFIGENIGKFDKDFDNKLLFSCQIAMSNRFPIEISTIISNFVPKPWNGNWGHKKCADFALTVTKSGRKVFNPVRFSNEKFVKGSGKSGCDQYDRSYDRGNFKDSEIYLENNSNLKKFIVDDQEEIEYNSSDSESDDFVSESETSCDESDFSDYE